MGAHGAAVKIALAQSCSVRGDVPGNTATHVRLIRESARLGAAVVAFPELSLTGYELDLAAPLAFTPDDRRIDPIAEVCSEHDIIAVVGLPLRLRDRLHLSELIVLPGGSRLVYTKNHLAPGEQSTFAPGELHPLLVAGAQVISFAICFDTENMPHVERAARQGTDIYLASSLLSRSWYPEGIGQLAGYARQFGMTVMVVNHGADSSTYAVAGGTSVWNPGGSLAGRVEGTGEALLVAEKTAVDRWTAVAHRTNGTR